MARFWRNRRNHRRRPQIRHRTRHRRGRGAQEKHGSEVEGVCGEGRGVLREGVVERDTILSLIAAFKTFGTPFLVGDVVLSVIAERDKPHFRLPTRDDLEEILPQEWHRRITSTCQKVYIISENFSVAWCDSYITAKAVIRALFSHFPSATSRIEHVGEFLSSLVGFEAPNCTLIGWISDG